MPEIHYQITADEMGSLQRFLLRRTLSLRSRDPASRTVQWFFGGIVLMTLAIIYGAIFGSPACGLAIIVPLFMIGTIWHSVSRRRRKQNDPSASDPIQMVLNIHQGWLEFIGVDKGIRTHLPPQSVDGWHETAACLFIIDTAGHGRPVPKAALSPSELDALRTWLQSAKITR